MIIPNFVQFREMFATTASYAAVGGVTVAFDAATKRIAPTVAPNFYAALGFQRGMRLRVVGTTSNDGWYTIADIDDAWIETTEALVNEAAATPTLTARHYDRDGYATWVPSRVRLAGSGFGNAGSTITGIPRPWTGATSGFTVTCNAGAADAAPGVDEYDWYLSQRSDDVARQLITTSDVANHSGSVLIEPNANAVDDAGYSFFFFGNCPREYLAPIFTRCHLYVQRRTDQAIQWVDLLQAQIATV